MQSLWLGVIVGLLLLAPESASAVTMTLDGGKPAPPDKSGVIEDEEWDMPDSGGTVTRTDNKGTGKPATYTATYKFPLPTTIAAGGTTVTISAGATAAKNEFDQHTRFNASMTVSGDIVAPGGSVNVQALADSSGQASKTTPAEITLTPRAGKAVVTVGIQDGPVYTYNYTAEQTKCASGGANAFAALTRVDLCDGSRTTVRAPADEPVLFLPEPMPDQADALEVFLALREVALEEEAEELAAAMEIRAKSAEEANQFKGCLLLGDELLGQAIPDYLTVNERRIALFRACQRMLLAETKKGADDKKRARSAARGCNAVFVPVFPRGHKVTKRMLERARDAERRQIAASCSDRRGKLSISIRARGDKKLPAIIGRRPPVAVMHRAPDATTDGPDRDLTARLRIRKG